MSACLTNCQINLLNTANFVHNFSQYIYLFSLHVSGDYVPIIRSNNFIYVTLAICHSVGMAVWYAGYINTVVSPDDGHIVARNM